MPIGIGNSGQSGGIGAVIGALAGGIASAIIVTLTLTTLKITEQAAPALSASGSATIYADSTAHNLQVSQNGGAYAALGGATFANPTASSTGAAINGVATTAMRSDAAPLINLDSAHGGTGVNNAGTITNASNTTITGGGTLALGGFTATVPATGTVAELGQANVFTTTQAMTLGTDVVPLTMTASSNTPTLNVVALNLLNGNHQVQFGGDPGFPATGGIWFGNTTPTDAHLAIEGTATTTAVNGNGTLALYAGNFSGGGFSFTSGLVSLSGADLSCSAGDYIFTGFPLTAGTMTVTKAAVINQSISRYSWTNAMVTALGASTTGDIVVCTLPAKTVVKNCYIVITGTAAGVTTLTVACGRTSAAYIDYIVASDAKVAANTVYGDAKAELGSNLYDGTTILQDLPSYTGTTAIKAHFISTVENLSSTTGSTGTIYLETVQLP